MGNFDYFMDEKEVKRAWARDRQQKHKEYMNTHYVKLATENMKLVLETAKCELPTRRCLDVNRMDLGQNKSYWPNCALVYKCGHDSGCCKSPDHVCSPVESHNIHLHFFSIEQNKEEQTGRVERLTFDNHTRCDCRPMPKHAVLSRSIPKKCECPTNFKAVTWKSPCVCDCDRKSSKSCRRIKKGRRSYPRKGCREKCDHPICDYGAYKKDFSRCPRKHEMRKENKKKLGK